MFCILLIRAWVALRLAGVGGGWWWIGVRITAPIGHHLPFPLTDAFFSPWGARGCHFLWTVHPSTISQTPDKQASLGWSPVIHGCVGGFLSSWMIRHVRHEWWWHVCWKATSDEKQKVEKLKGIHCFYCSPERQIIKPRRCSITVVVLFLNNERRCFLDKRTGTFSIGEVWHHPKLKQINHTICNAIPTHPLWGGWVLEWRVCSPATHRWKPRL